MPHARHGADHGYGAVAACILGYAVPVIEDRDMRDLACIDGDTIRFNPGHAGLSNPDDIPLAIMLQATLIRCGSLDRRMAATLIGRPALTRRYLAIEALRAVRQCADLLPRRLLAYPVFRDSSVVSASPMESRVRAVNNAAVEPAHPLLGAWYPAASLRRAPAAWRATAAVGEAAFGVPQPLPMDPADDTEASTLLKLLDLGGGPLAGLFARLFGRDRQPGARRKLEEGHAHLIDDAPGQSRPPPGSDIYSRRRQSPFTAPPAVPPSIYRYDEWDVGLGRYRHGWTRVEDAVPRAPDHGVAPLVPPPPGRRMRRQLAAIRPGLEFHSRQPSGDDIVLDHLVDRVVQAHAGDQADPLIYRALRRTGRELGVLLLIDSSASVQDRTDDGGSIQQQQITLAAQIGGVLCDAGNRVALYGFNSWGRDRVQMLRVKGFDERMGAVNIERLQLLVPAGFTRMGAALRHAGRVVAERSGMKCRLVVLITDGISYDDGYESRHAEADTRRSIAELNARSIGCACISVGGDTEAVQLARVFGEAAFLRADRLDLVAGQIGALFRQAIAMAGGAGGRPHHAVGSLLR